MTHKIEDNEYFSWIEFHPETAEELALLLRLTNNTLRETPSITTFFSDDKPMCLVQFKKKDGNYTNKYISNRK